MFRIVPDSSAHSRGTENAKPSLLISRTWSLADELLLADEESAAVLLPDIIVWFSRGKERRVFLKSLSLFQVFQTTFNLFSTAIRTSPGWKDDGRIES